MIHSATAVELLQALIRIPSVNPEGDPGVDNPGEAACAGFLADRLDELGATTTIEEVLPGRPNVVGRLPSDQPGKKILVLAPHTDTVSVRGMTIPPFDAESRDGRVSGRGASDTKGPMAAMLKALADRIDRVPGLPVEIWFAGLMGEEAGQQGARAFTRSHQVDFAVVAEPTGLGTVHAHKGCLWLSLRAAGRAAHASCPGEGDNAILRMVGALSWLADRLARDLDTADPLLGRPTFNVGTIRGGSKVNIIPDSCECQIDIRTVSDPDTAETVTRVIVDLEDRFPGLTAKTRASPSLDTPADHPLVRWLAEAGSPPVTAPWFCDAAVFSQAGVPSVAVGPGSITQAHTADEFIRVADLEDGVALFTRFLDRLGDQSV